MPRVDVREETKLFGERLQSNYYSKERSTNTEVDYAKVKEPRDTQAVKDFIETETFNYIMNMR